MKTTNMDYRLDLFSAAEQYLEQMTENDALFLIAHNTKDNDLFVTINGDWAIISGVLSDKSGYIKLENEEDKDRHREMQSAVLNMAINILHTHEEYRGKFKEALNNF